MNVEDFDDAWLERLDAVIAGEHVPQEQQDERLHLAKQLSDTLSPLTTLSTKDEEAYRRMRAKLHEQLPEAQDRMQRFKPVRQHLCLLTVLALLCLLSLGIVELRSLGGIAVSRNAGALGQAQRPDPSQLARPHAGIHPLPLLPAVQPRGTQTVLYGVVTDPHDPNLLLQFVMDYRIQGHDLLLTEQPSPLPFTSSSHSKKVRNVRIGNNLVGQVFQDDQGNTALQWYQNQMVCQFVSTLPDVRMIEIASAFRPLTSWNSLL